MGFPNAVCTWVEQLCPSFPYTIDTACSGAHAGGIAAAPATNPCLNGGLCEVSSHAIGRLLVIDGPILTGCPCVISPNMTGVTCWRSMHSRARLGTFSAESICSSDPSLYPCFLVYF